MKLSYLVIQSWVCDAVSWSALNYPKVEIWGYYLRNAFCGTGFVLSLQPGQFLSEMFQLLS